MDPLCPIVVLLHSSINGVSVNSVDEGETLMTPLIKYLANEELPSGKNKARVLRIRAVHYTFEFRQLYKRGYSIPLLKCITFECGLYIMQEIHEGICGNDSGPRSLFHKVILQGYYWPSMLKDVEAYV